MEETCLFPDCKQAEKGNKNGFCLEHAKLARFIIDVIHANISLDDIL